jgi:hypothetical protein
VAGEKEVAVGTCGCGPMTLRLNYGVGDTGTALKNEFKFEVSHE